jgi:hypothetical protein
VWLSRLHLFVYGNESIGGDPDRLQAQFFDTFGLRPVAIGRATRLYRRSVSRPDAPSRSPEGPGRSSRLV